MLLPEEFTVGTVASAPAGSLILPRSKYEEVFIIGVIDETHTAIVLSGQFKFNYFPAKGAENRSGLIIPNVRYEVDESTAFNPEHVDLNFGVVVRKATELSVYATEERSFGHSRAVPLLSKLPATYNGSVGFTKWQVVLGPESNKRILLKIDVKIVNQ